MLRIRTCYSFRTAAGHIDDVISRLKETGAKEAPITDRASTFGWVRWTKAAKEAGLRPVLGIELAVAESVNAKKPNVDHWTFFAKNGIEGIAKLVDLATQQFRYQPLLNYEQATKTQDVIAIAGHRARLDQMNPRKKDLYISLGPATVRGYYNEAKKRGFKFAASGDNLYPRPDDRGLWEIICGRNAQTQSYPQHILDEGEWRASIAHLELPETEIKAALAASRAILGASKASLGRASLLRPNRPQTLRDMCKDGAKRLGVDLSDPVYKARMDRELKLIEQKDFEDYFYIVADMVMWARARMLVGPARGSSCGSLVCYLLGITTIDPIPYRLIFERFIDINRSDLPDIDIDFSDQQRSLVFDYVNEKYGNDRVARLGTVALFRPKAAMKEAGTALQIPKWICDAVTESLVERSSGDARAMLTLEDTLRSMPAGQDLLRDYPEAIIVARMEGHPSHYGQHAAGVVIAQEPIRKYIPVDHKTGATMCNKEDAEYLNLLKIDALGLTQLSIFEDALALAGLPRDHLDHIPLDDILSFEVLNQGRFSGIFQFNGIALQSIVKQFKVTEFNDLVSVTALARPGPLASGGSNEWVLRRNGSSNVSYPHPIFKPYLEDTLGIVIYQEQVMEIGRNVGDLSWEDVTALRKAMSKSLGAEYFNKFGDPWKAAAIKKGVDPKVVTKIWDDLCAYGSWSFNKSHSVAYGMISYQCCWLKANYPLEFAAATLSHEGDPNRQLKLLRELVDEGYEYIPVDADISVDKWTVGQRGNKRYLVGPLSNVKGIGPAKVQQVLGARARGERVPDSIRKLLTNAKTSIDSLTPIRDAVHRIMPDPAEKNIFTPPTSIVNCQITNDEQSFLIYCVFSNINPRDENEAVLVAKRGWEMKGQTAYLNLHMMDDTDTIFGKITRHDYMSMGKPIVDRGRPGKAIYAVKGTMRAGGTFRMISIQNVRYIGDIDK